MHTVRYNGAYSSVARAKAKTEGKTLNPAPLDDDAPSSAERRRRRRSWARMLARIYQVEPLLCTCGALMKIISFITEHRVIHKILDHVRGLEKKQGRGPPEAEIQT